MKTKKIRTSDTVQNDSEKREKLLTDLIEKAKQKGIITPIAKK
jgi:hypothetical protein